jgi:hypothetical protein
LPCALEVEGSRPTAAELIRVERHKLPILGDLPRRLQGSQTSHGHAIHVVGMPLDRVLDAVTVLTPSSSMRAASASSRVLRVVARSYQLKYWFAATICAAT